MPIFTKQFHLHAAKLVVKEFYIQLISKGILVGVLSTLKTKISAPGNGLSNSRFYLKFGRISADAASNAGLG